MRDQPVNGSRLWQVKLGPQAGLADRDCAVVGAIGVLQSHVPHQSHAPQQQQQQQMGAFQYSAFNAAAQVPQMDALEMQLASMQGMPGYGKACSIPNRSCREEQIVPVFQSMCIPSLQAGFQVDTSPLLLHVCTAGEPAVLLQVSGLVLKKGRAGFALLYYQDSLEPL